MPNHEKIDYLEYPAIDLSATKTFFSKTFDWTFEDFGPEYTAFDKQGVEGGFYKAELVSNSDKGTALAIFYSEDLESTLAKVVDNGGVIVKQTFSFPGGRRFHFTEPSGNEFAVWSDK